MNAVRWTVTLTNRDEIDIAVPDTLPEHVAERRAMFRAEEIYRTGYTVDRTVRAFAARPQGCSGISYRAHCGRFCPVHLDTGGAR